MLGSRDRCPCRKPGVPDLLKSSFWAKPFWWHRILDYRSKGRMRRKRAVSWSPHTYRASVGCFRSWRTWSLPELFSHTSWSSCCLLAGLSMWGSILGGLGTSPQAGPSTAAVMKRDLNKVEHSRRCNTEFCLLWDKIGLNLLFLCAYMNTCMLLSHFKKHFLERHM